MPYTTTNNYIQSVYNSLQYAYIFIKYTTTLQQLWLLYYTFILHIFIIIHYYHYHDNIIYNCLILYTITYNNNSSTYNILSYNYIAHTILYILNILYIILSIFHAIAHNCTHYSNKITICLYNYLFYPVQIQPRTKLSDNLYNCLYNFLELIWTEIYPYLYAFTI